MAARNRRRLTWTDVASAATAVTLNVGAVALLSLTDLGLRRPAVLPHEPLLIYLDEPWPIFARPPRAQQARPDRPASRSRRERATIAPRNDSLSAVTPPAAAEAEADQDGIEARWRVGQVARGPDATVASCDAPHLLSPEARRRCDSPWAGRENVRAIAGTGNAERDAIFARHGARRLAAWEKQRAMPARGDPPCERPNPVSGCDGVNIQVELFSSQDGVLPNLRKRRE